MGSLVIRLIHPARSLARPTPTIAVQSDALGGRTMYIEVDAPSA